MTPFGGKPWHHEVNNWTRSPCYPFQCRARETSQDSPKLPLPNPYTLLPIGTETHHPLLVVCCRIIGIVRINEGAKMVKSRLLRGFYSRRRSTMMNVSSWKAETCVWIHGICIVQQMERDHVRGASTAKICKATWISVPPLAWISIPPLDEKEEYQCSSIWAQYPTELLSRIGVRNE